MGVLFLCLLVPYYIEMSSVYAALRLRAAAEADRRISLTNQMVSGIRAIKARAWEDDFRGKIKHHTGDIGYPPVLAEEYSIT